MFGGAFFNLVSKSFFPGVVGRRGISIDTFWIWDALGLALPVDVDDIGQFVSLTFPQLSNGRLQPNVGLEALVKFISWFLVYRKKAIENSTATHNDSKIPY